jgi:hypothetical protein
MFITEIFTQRYINSQPSMMMKLQELKLKISLKSKYFKKCVFEKEKVIIFAPQIYFKA